MIVSNPNATKVVEIEGSKFTIGILPYGKRIELESMTLQNADAKTREGYQNILLQNEEFVRWGVKAHSGLEFQDGQAVEFKSKAELFGGRQMDIVADEVLDIYAATPGLLMKLATAVTDFNYMKEQEVKN